MKRVLRDAVYAALIWISAGAVPAFAQLDTGAIVGTVRNQSAAVVPGATVTATQESTGSVSTAVTTEKGQFVFPNLKIGTYSTVAEAIAAHPTASAPVAPPTVAPPPRRWRPALIAAIVAVAAASAWIVFGKRFVGWGGPFGGPVPAMTMVRSVGNLDLATAASLSPEQMTVATGLDGYLAFSPDGASIAYSSDRSGALEVYVEGLAEGSVATSLTRGAGQSIQPAWSPDGRLHRLRRASPPAASGSSRRAAVSPARSPSSARTRRGRPMAGGSPSSRDRRPTSTPAARSAATRRFGSSTPKGAPRRRR